MRVMLILIFQLKLNKFGGLKNSIYICNMEKEVKPISPNEIVENLDKIIPSAIIQAVNQLLTEKYRGNGEVSIKQKDIIERACSLDDTLTSDIIYKNKYLDFEDLYRKNGWKVGYDKPAYNETYEAFFTFDKKK